MYRKGIPSTRHRDETQARPAPSLALPSVFRPARTAQPLSDSVQAALGLRGTGPTPGTGVLTGGYASRARGAADRAVPVGQQWVDEHAVLGDVGVDVVLRPGRDRIYEPVIAA